METYDLEGIPHLIECFWSNYQPVKNSSHIIPVPPHDTVTALVYLSIHNRFNSFVDGISLRCEAVDDENSVANSKTKSYLMKNNEGKYYIQFCPSKDFNCRPNQHYNLSFFAPPCELIVPIVCVEHKVMLHQSLGVISNDNKSLYFALDVELQGFFSPDQSIKVAIDILYESFQVVRDQHVLELKHLTTEQLSERRSSTLLSQIESRMINAKFVSKESLEHNRYVLLRSNQQITIAFKVKAVSSTHVQQSFRLRAMPISSQVTYDRTDSLPIVDCSKIAPGYTEAFQVVPRLPGKKRKRKGSHEDQPQGDECYEDEEGEDEGDVDG